MNIKTTTKEKYDYGEVLKEGTPIVYLNITADCYSENTVHEVAVRTLYKDLLMSGAGTYSRDEFLQALNELGSSIQVSSSAGRITIEVATLEKQLNKTLLLLETMLLKPSFKAGELKRAISTAQNSLELYQEDAKTLAQDGLLNKIFADSDRHFRQNPEKVSEELAKITVADIKNLQQRFMNIRWIVTSSGNKKALSTIEKTILKLKQSFLAETRVMTATKNPEIINRQVVSKLVASKQNVEISIGASLPFLAGEKELAHFVFGLAVLGKWSGFAGRLMSTVREKEGLTYCIYARTEGISKLESGYWRIMTFFAPKDTVKGIESTLREISKIREKGITKSELERFRTILQTSNVLMFDTLAGTTSVVHNNLLSGMSWEEAGVFKQILYTCTLSEVNKALKKYLDPTKLVISAAGPVGNIGKDLEKLSTGRQNK